MNCLICPEMAFLVMFVFFAVYSILDGFALGIGCMVPFAGKKEDAERLVSHIAPFWEANEIWLIMAVGFMFAAFPVVFATMISTFYLPFMTAIVALILRAVALEFSYHDLARVRLWRGLMGLGSFLVLFASAVALGFVLSGLQFVSPCIVSGDISGALSALPLMFGCAGLAFFVWHGVLHTRSGSVSEPVAREATVVWAIAVVSVVATALVWFAKNPSLMEKPLFWLGGVVCLSGLILSRFLAGRGRWAFRASSLAVIGLWGAVAASLFPNLMVSAGNPDWTISIYQAVAPESSLRVAMLASPVLIAAILSYNYFIQKVIRR